LANIRNVEDLNDRLIIWSDYQRASTSLDEYNYLRFLS